LNYPDVNGNFKRLSSLNGKTILLYFWSVYSDDCKLLNPSFENTYKKYKSKNFEIFAVCIDKEKDTWSKMIKYEDFTYINTIGSDFPDSEASHIFNLRSVPATYLINKDMNIIARDLFGPELEKWLDNTL